jgi:hypothetical protein
MAAEELVKEEGILERRLPVAMSTVERGGEAEREQERAGDGAKAR